MRHLSLVTTLSLASLLIATTASAQTPEPTSVRLAGAVAIDPNEPQDTRFGPGAGGALKLTFDLTPWLDVAPSVMTDQFAPQPGFSGVSGLWAFGAGLRIKRPHHIVDNSYWNGSSPWIDGDVQYIRTGDLNRLGWSVGVGLATPMDDAHHWWLGPFARYTDVVDGTTFGGNPTLNNTDAHIITVGLDLEFDFSGTKRPAAPVAEEKKLVVAKLPTPKTPATYQTVVTKQTETDTLAYVVQFDFDSAVLSADAKTNLDSLANRIQQLSKQPDVSVDHVEVDGHASNENHPWAEKHNQLLSERRAAAVVGYLASKGLAEALLSAKGFGIGSPTADNKTEAGRIANRRAEFKVTVTVTTKVQVKQ